MDKCHTELAKPCESRSHVPSASLASDCLSEEQSGHTPGSVHNEFPSKIRVGGQLGDSLKTNVTTHASRSTEKRSSNSSSITNASHVPHRNKQNVHYNSQIDKRNNYIGGPEWNKKKSKPCSVELKNITQIKEHSSMLDEHRSSATFERPLMYMGGMNLASQYVVPDVSPRGDFKCYLEEPDSSEKVTIKLMNMWNNVRYGWKVKTKTDFSVNEPVWIFGCSYDLRDGSTEDGPLSGAEKIRLDYTSRLWFTYRKDFQAIPGSLHTSDSGWGCMIRSGQMMLAQALMLHFLSREWRLTPNQPRSKMVFHREIIRWFADMNSSKHPFSIHNLVATGTSQGKSPGDWYGPTSVAFLLKETLQNAQAMNPLLGQLCIYVAQDCTVYKKDVEDLCMASDPSANAEASWRSLVLMVPIRLGGAKVNMVYASCLTTFFHTNFGIGIIGGKPKHSLYFIGYQEDKFICMDPHYSQQFVDVECRDFPLDSFHCSSLCKLPIKRMDPSCTLGFYLRSRRDWNEFCVLVPKLFTPSGEYPLFGIEAGSASDVAKTPTLDKPRILRVRHVDVQGRLVQPLLPEEDFVLL